MSTTQPTERRTAYLIHWTSTSPEHGPWPASADGASSVMSASRVNSDAELIGFLLNLPGDGTFIVWGVSEL